jgi:formylglycine-generating enzyme required for sulfatase activity
MRSHDELLAVSGYGSRPKEFDDLIRVLDSELRLITPTDPEGKEREEDLNSQVQTGAKYYQLTHDYLVHSVWNWLTLKQKETRRGRAELLLADRSTVWNARPENRQLPSLLQWFRIRCLTQKKNWTPPQRKMMRKAIGYHAVRKLVVAILFGMFLSYMLWVVNFGGPDQAQVFRDRLLESTTADVPWIIKEMARYRRNKWLDPLLRQAYAQAEETKDSRKQLHASLALLPVDPAQIPYLYGRLLRAEPQELTVIREALFDHRQDQTERLWTLLEDPRNDQDQRYRAACALAAFDPANSRWEKVRGDVAEMLVIQKPFMIAQWTDALKSVDKWLISPLAEFLEDERRSVSERGLIASIYGTYAANIPDAYSRLEKRLTEHGEPDASPDAKVALTLTKRQLSIGLALMVMDRTEKVWPLLKHNPDPTLRSLLIDQMAPAGVNPMALWSRFENDQEASIKRAILLSLGEYGLDRLLLVERRNKTLKLLQVYRDDPDPGIHGAAEWLLRQWQMDENLKKIDRELATGKVEGKRQWYINRQGQTMVIVADAGNFRMGEGFQRHRQKIGRTFALASKEVTVEQFLKFRKEFAKYGYFKKYSPTSDCPINHVTWYEAAEYCNWLSEQEGIPKDQWCYFPNHAGQYAQGMQMAANFLQRTGYRLPTEAEWEYACRAGADTEFSYGTSADLLGKYANYGNVLSRTQPGGKLRPNDQGLFDMHGNVWEWCQDHDAQQNASKEIDDSLGVLDKEFRVVRGGSFRDYAKYVRSGSRFSTVPADRNFFGFRAARTLTTE